MRILGFGTYDAAKHPRAAIVLDGLREHGVEVVEANVPLGFSTAERVRMLGNPLLAYRLVLRLLRCWLRLVGAARRARRDGPVDAVVVGYMGHFDVILARLLFPRTTVILDMLIFAASTARDRGVNSGLKLRLLATLDRIALRSADLVLVDTEEHAGEVPASMRHKAVVVPVGALDEWFEAAALPSGEGERLTVAFFGLFTPLQGAPTIGAAIGALADRPDIRFTMIGTGQDYDATRAAAAANGNVDWRDWVDAAELPELVAAHDVCLGIFGTTPKALRVTPNKVYQGAAAGCAVVTSDTAPQWRALDGAGRFVPPGDADALAAALRTLADDRAAVEAARAAARETARVSFTAREVARPLLARLSGDAAAS